MYEVIEERSGETKVAEGLNRMISREEIVIRRNAAYVLVCNAHKEQDGGGIDFWYGAFLALQGLLS